jgi:hypothetical protein
MIKLIFVLTIGVIGLSFQNTNAQNMSKSLGLHVFPSNNQDQATQEADEDAVATSADLAADYNKAFSVCMEGKGYPVK